MSHAMTMGTVRFSPGFSVNLMAIAPLICSPLLIQVRSLFGRFPSFSKDGNLPNSDRTWISSGEQINGAIAIKFTLKPGEKRTVPMVIAWDMPVVQFGSGRKWHRHYTEFFNTEGNNAWKIAREGLLNAGKWSDAIDSWQAKYVEDESKPLWYRGMLFNEMYIVADGGSFWGHEVGAAPKTPGPSTFQASDEY